jgi:hypothetical protein
MYSNLVLDDTSTVSLVSIQPGVPGPVAGGERHDRRGLPLGRGRLLFVVLLLLRCCTVDTVIHGAMIPQEPFMYHKYAHAYAGFLSSGCFVVLS